MQTLLEFMIRTEGLGYIVAGAFLIAFVPFWLFLVGRQDNE